VVHLPGLNGGVCRTAVADHVRAFTQHQASALTPRQSAEMLGEMTAQPCVAVFNTYD
jgi:hypothetical protein